MHPFDAKLAGATLSPHCTRCMTERRRPHRRGRGPRPSGPAGVESTLDETNPYRDADDAPGGDAGVRVSTDTPTSTPAPAGDDGAGTPARDSSPATDSTQREQSPRESTPRESAAREAPRRDKRGRPPRDNREQREPRSDGKEDTSRRRRGQSSRRRGRTPRSDKQQVADRVPTQPVSVDGETTGWFEIARDGGYVRLAENSYLSDPGDAFIPAAVVRSAGLRRGDLVTATFGKDNRGRVVVSDVVTVNGSEPGTTSRPDFGTLTASYPERKLFLETGQPAKSGPELTRRAIDIIAPIGNGQRALIVAPARAGKTMLLQAIVEGVATNHPDAALFVLLVDERPEEVSEMITWGYGEVVASSFDQPAERHTSVAEMVLERSRRLVELGQDVVIVLDSITRLARAYNTVERGTGRTLSGGLDAQAMAKPKAFFGSARAVMDGGSLTIIATALVETGSRMDDVIFEEFKGTGNCEIKLDRSLAEKRIFPAIDIATSGTRREEKLFRPDQLDAVYTLRRGLHQMPPQSAMEWLIKRIAGTPNNDALLDGL